MCSSDLLDLPEERDEDYDAAETDALLEEEIIEYSEEEAEADEEEIMVEE